MNIKFYAPRWGSESLSWSEFTSKAVKDGYQGVEVYPLETLHEKSELLKTIEGNNLDLALIHSEMNEGRDFELYKHALAKNLYVLAEYQTNNLKPAFINSQTGR